MWPMGYRLRGHEGEKNYYFSKIQLVKAQNNGQQVAGHDDRPNIF